MLYDATKNTRYDLTHGIRFVTVDRHRGGHSLEDLNTLQTLR
ncbi:CRISPR-associated DxTHG motif protein [Mesorhizobium sp. M2A.F.Ca.ET.040.01.1.1]|nr:CRISPR-associated DxTHG motif protein [Mesorhizobium sp. M2A.F.Ca.ET.040.01.1.1]